MALRSHTLVHKLIKPPHGIHQKATECAEFYIQVALRPAVWAQVPYGRNSTSLVVDPARGKLYWTNFGTNAIYRAKLDGSPSMGHHGSQTWKVVDLR